MLYKLISPLLQESMKAKIRIYKNGEEQDVALQRKLNEESINVLPKSFWSHHKHHHHHNNKQKKNDMKMILNNSIKNN